MKHFFNLSIFLSIILSGCMSDSKDANSENNSIKADSIAMADSLAAIQLSETLEFELTGVHADADNVLLRVAILGDAEPKPLAEFPNMNAAVDHINKLAESEAIDFVIGVGDIAHKGTEIQYQAATKVLQKLKAPFYPIMGNEERDTTEEIYLHYAQQWNNKITQSNYVLNHEKVAFVFASPDFGRDFDNNGVAWIVNQIERLAPKPVILIVHGAQKGVYTESPDKGIENPKFKNEVIPQVNLAAVISGDLHMDMDRVNHSKKIGHVHYLHIPALERTKIPDETNHTPMIRVMTIAKDGKISIDTYKVGEDKPIEKHAYTFSLAFH